MFFKVWVLNGEKRTFACINTNQITYILPDEGVVGLSDGNRLELPENDMKELLRYVGVRV